MYEKNKDKKQSIVDSINNGCLTSEATTVDEVLDCILLNITDLNRPSCLYDVKNALQVNFSILCNSLQYAIGNAEYSDNKAILIDLQDVLACYH